MDNQIKKRAIVLLFNAFPSAEEREAAYQSLAEIYLLAVQDCDEIYVERAVHQFVTGKVKRTNQTFRPSCAELGAYARSLQEKDRGFETRQQERRKRIQLTNDFQHGKTAQERAEHVRSRLGYNPDRSTKARPEALPVDSSHQGTLKYWDNNPLRWRDKAELQASLKRIQGHLRPKGAIETEEETLPSIEQEFTDAAE
jgi:hypothetical protein